MSKRKRHHRVKREPRPRGMPLSFFMEDDPPVQPVVDVTREVLEKLAPAERKVLPFTRRTVCRWPEDK